MKKLGFVACVVLGAVLGAIAGHSESPRVPDEVAVRSQRLRDQVETLRTRFAAVKRDLGAITTPAAATAAREKLFQLRVDMVAVEDELAVLAGRRAVAR